MKKVLFLMGKGNKKEILSKWKAGKAFFPLKEEPGLTVLSIRSVDIHRSKYKKVCIQYDTGVVEV